MADQADQLRELVRGGARVRAKPQAAGGAALVVVTGCQSGVGATTVAVNVGAVLADRGARVLVVDAAGGRSDVMEIAGIRSTGSSMGPDGMVAGPGEMKLLAARSGVSTKRKFEVRTSTSSVGTRNSSTWTDLLAAWKPVRSEFDVTVIDAGAGLSRTARRLWLRAQLVLLVTTSDDAAVMDAYAATKRHMVGSHGATCENIRVLVNRAESDRVAADAHRRLTNCCQRFLRQNVEAMPALPRWGDDDDASVGSHPRIWEAPNSEFGHAVLWLGRAVGDALEAVRE